MRNFYFLLFFISLSKFMEGQIIRIATTPSQIINQIPAYSEVSNYSTKSFNYTPSMPPTTAIPIDGDTTTEDDKIYRYADNLPVNISITDGNITTTSVGKVWTIKLSVPNALNLGIVFNNFDLSQTAELYIFNESQTALDSCIKSEHFTDTNQIGIAPFVGSALIIYIFEPNNFGTFQSSVSLKKMEAGYQEIYDVGDVTAAFMRGTSVGCDPEVICEPGKMFSARAVGRFVSNGYQGTGTLINNEANNGKAYFLTAFHVIDVSGWPGGGSNGIIDQDEEAALANARFRFQFWRTTCNGSINNDGISFSGAILIAASQSTDIVLLELLNPPGIGDGVNYAGWTRQTTAPADYGSYIIHHPRGKDMRITSTKKVKDWPWNNNFWTTKYLSGTVDKGSSGSALFNENGLITGQLRSGWSSCDFTDFGDRYGKFYQSWNGANLQQWLSPGNNQSCNSLIVSPLTISGNSIIPCDGSPVSYSVPNLSGCNFSWTISGPFYIVSGQGTSKIVVAKNSSSSLPHGIVKVTINDSKGRNRLLTVEKSVTLSASDINLASLVKSGPSCVTSSNQPISFGVNFNGHTGCQLRYMAEITEVEWQIMSPHQYQLIENYGAFTCSNVTAVDNAGITLAFEYPVYGPYMVTLRFRLKNECGIWSPWSVGYYHQVQACGWNFNITPNPASNTIDINTETGEKLFKIQISDNAGNLLRQEIFKIGLEKITFNISELKQGVYFIRVFNGTEWAIKKLIKK